jgi:adenine nucleotide transporter 17
MATAQKSTAAESTKPLPTTTAAQQSDNVAHALAGAGGGLLSMALTYPLITLSTRAQVESSRAETSALDAAKKIIKREGLGGLYAGLDSALVGIGLTNFVYYYCMALCYSTQVSQMLNACSDRVRMVPLGVRKGCN